MSTAAIASEQQGGATRTGRGGPAWRLPRLRRDAALPWLVPIGLVVVWQALCSLGILNARLLPAPVDVVAAGWRLTLSGELPHHMWVSTQRALWGLAIGGSIGFALGILNGLVVP